MACLSTVNSMCSRAWTLKFWLERSRPRLMFEQLAHRTSLFLSPTHITKSERWRRATILRAANAQRTRCSEAQWLCNISSPAQADAHPAMGHTTHPDCHGDRPRYCPTGSATSPPFGPGGSLQERTTAVVDGSITQQCQLHALDPAFETGKSNSELEKPSVYRGRQSECEQDT